MSVEYIAFVGGELVLAPDAHELITNARSDVFVAWRVDRSAERLERLLVQRAGDAWSLIDEAGRIIQTVPGVTSPIHDEVCAIIYSAPRQPLALVVNAEAWSTMHPPEERPFYTPFGFSLPARWNNGPGVPFNVVYDWCPAIVCSQIEHLTEGARQLYLYGMLHRILHWALVVANPEPFDYGTVELEIDTHMHENYPDALRVINGVHLAVLDQMGGRHRG